MSQTEESKWDDSLAHLSVHTSAQNPAWFFSTPSSVNGTPPATGFQCFQAPGSSDLVVASSSKFIDSPPTLWQPQPHRTSSERSAFQPPSRRNSGAAQEEPILTNATEDRAEPPSVDHDDAKNCAMDVSLMTDEAPLPSAFSQLTPCNPSALASSLSTPISSLPTPATLPAAPPAPSEVPPSFTPNKNSSPNQSGGFTRAPGLGPPTSSESIIASTSSGAPHFVCDVCAFSCGSKFHFNSHLNTHKDNKCCMCNYTCRTEGRLKKHMMESHSREQQEAAGISLSPPFTASSSSSASASTPTLQRSGATSNDSSALSVQLSSVSTPPKETPSTASASPEIVDVTTVPKSRAESPVPQNEPEPSSSRMNLSDAIFRMISATEATSSALDQMRTLSEQPMLCTESAPSTSALSLPEALRGIGLSLPAHPPAAQTAGKSRSEGRRAKHKNYKCRQCAHISMSKDEMWTHAREHIPKEKRMECEKCNFVTEYKHHLEYHNRNHAGLKPFQCKLCAYTCVNKSMLNSHMKSHSTTYMFKCKNCTYATKYCHSLKLHLKKYEHIRNVEPSKDEDSAPNAERMEEEPTNNATQGEEPVPFANADPQPLMGAHFSGFAGFPSIVAHAPVDYASLLRQHQWWFKYERTVVRVTRDKKGSDINGKERLSDQVSSMLGLNNSHLASYRCNLCDFTSTSAEESYRHNLSHMLAPPASASQLAAAANSLYSQIPASVLPLTAAEAAQPGHWITEDDDTTSPSHEGTGSRCSAQSPHEGEKTIVEVGGVNGVKTKKSKASRIDEIGQRLREKTSPEVASTPNTKSEMDVEEVPVATATVQVTEANGQLVLPNHNFEAAVDGDGFNALRQACFAAFQQSPDFRWLCSHCKMAFQDGAMHQIHMGFHGYENVFQCNRCGEVCGDALSFNLHLLQSSHG